MTFRFMNISDVVKDLSSPIKEIEEYRLCFDISIKMFIPEMQGLGVDKLWLNMFN